MSVPDAPEPPHALIERRGHVLVVTMNRPRARNALSGPMMALMRQAWDEVDADPQIRVAVLTGAGGAFCAGADLKAMTAAPPGDSFSHGGMDLSVIDALLKGRRLAKPLIAAVEGAAIAGGTEILQATDITIAADLLLTGRHISADEARRIGLIGEVVPDGQALSRALEVAGQIAANGPLAVQAILRTIRQTEGMAENEAFAVEARIGMEVFKSADAKEGPRAFADKRSPVFQGR